MERLTAVAVKQVAWHTDAGAATKNSAHVVGDTELNIRRTLGLVLGQRWLQRAARPRI